MVVERRLMVAQQLEQPAQATSDAAGAATFTFPPVPQSLAWVGVAFCPSAPFTAEFVPVIGATAWPQWNGPQPYGAFLIRSRLSLVVSATALVPNTQYTMYLIGTSDYDTSTPAVIPTPAPPPSQTFSATTFLETTQLGATYLSAAFECSNVKGARYAITNSAAAAHPALVTLIWTTEDGLAIAARNIIVPSGGGTARFTQQHLGDKVQLQAAPLSGGTLSLIITAAHHDSDITQWHSVFDPSSFSPDSPIVMSNAIGAASSRTQASAFIYAGAALFAASTTGVKWRALLEAQDVNAAWQLVAELDQATAGGQYGVAQVIVPPAPLRITTFNDDAAGTTNKATLTADAWRS